MSHAHDILRKPHEHCMKRAQSAAAAASPAQHGAAQRQHSDMRQPLVPTSTLAGRPWCWTRPELRQIPGPRQAALGPRLHGQAAGGEHAAVRVLVGLRRTRGPAAQPIQAHEQGRVGPRARAARQGACQLRRRQRAHHLPHTWASRFQGFETLS